MAADPGASLESPTVPDAHDTIRDFMDYTDIFPSDLMRSLTLIRKLDSNYLDAANEVHKLTAIYGSAPEIPLAQRPDLQALRKEISANLDYAFYCRESAYAEAARLYDVAKRYDDRLVIIKSKLQALPEPPSRDPTPPLASPQSKRKQDNGRGPRLTLHIDNARTRAVGAAGGHGGRKGLTSSRAAIASSDDESLEDSSDPTEWDNDLAPSSVGRKRGGAQAGSAGRKSWAGPSDNTIKIPNLLKIASTPRTRAPGVMGTNVHSAVAGISTSNALAKLTPPPGDARPGSLHAPWHKLTEFEMATLRKTMKKNAIWNPSDTMIRRELAKKNRGREHYEKAKVEASTSGEAFLDEDPLDPTKTVLAPGEISFEPTGRDEEQLMNRGMKLNEAKKLKKETMAREQAAHDAMEIEEALRAITNAGELIERAFSKPSEVRRPSNSTTISSIRGTPQSSRKRKRQGSQNIDGQDSRDAQETPVPTGPKRLKIAPPAPPGSLQPSSPVLIRSAGASGTISKGGNSSKATTTQVPLAPAGSSAAGDLPMRNSTSPSEVKRTPIPPPITAAASRSRRTSTGVKQGESTTPTSAGARTPTANVTLRPRSRGGELASTGLKVSSAEPKNEGRGVRDLRRMSNVSLPSPTNGNAKSAKKPNGAAGGAAARRSRRPAPGVVSSQEDGNKVSMGKRKAAPQKKANAGRRTSKGKEVEVPEQDADDADPIDPDEPRYCVCGDVSYGAMIACENEDCEKEWFHLECVGLAQIPPRRRKWYCEDCRKLLGIDEEGYTKDTATLLAVRKGR